MIAPTRPVLRYHGGKWRIAPWIISHFPPHRIYVEPFAGAASVLMLKPRVQAECINDLDSRVVAVFRCLRDEKSAAELQRRLLLTPYARDEFDEAYEPAVDEVDAVRKTIMLAFMGFGSDSIGRGYRTGFRGKMSDARALPSIQFANWPYQVPAFLERLRGVTIENRDAAEVCVRMDKPETLFYVDPPYPHHTRTSSVGKHGYRHEMTDDQHRALALVLRELNGMVVVSGYSTPLYDDVLFAGWHRVSREALADGARPRTEVLWMNFDPHSPSKRIKATGLMTHSCSQPSLFTPHGGALSLTREG